MTEAIERIRAALAAGPTPGPWVFGKYHRDTTIATVCHVSEFSVGPDGGDYDGHGACKDDADYIAACNPAAMAEVLDHIDAQAQEIERLKQQLRYQEHRDGRIGTHAEGCYSFGPSHYECALSEIERLRADVQAVTAAERERAAKVCEDVAKRQSYGHAKSAAGDCADFIRSGE